MRGLFLCLGRLRHDGERRELVADDFACLRIEDRRTGVDPRRDERAPRGHPSHADREWVIDAARNVVVAMIRARSKSALATA